MPIMEETGLRSIEENCVRKFLDGKKTEKRREVGVWQLPEKRGI